MAHKAYFFAAGATQKRTLHSRTVMLNIEKCHVTEIFTLE